MNGRTNLSEHILGETAGTVHLETRSEIRTACALMAAQANRGVRIFSRDLDAPYYDHIDFLESIRRLALRNPHTPVRILLFDAEPAVRKGHRLIGLARKLTSRIQIRRVPAEFHHHTQAYLLADDRGYVLRKLADSFEAKADFAAPVEVRRMGGQFEHLWERSEEPHEIRVFGRGL